MKARIVVVPIISLVAGLLVGYVLGTQNIPPIGVSGDVAKVNRYKKDVVDESSQLIIEKLKSDEQFKNEMLSSLTLISARAGEYYVNASIAAGASKNIDELQDVYMEMLDLYAVADNISTNSSEALIALEAALNGEEEAGLSELLSNAFLSYMMLGKNLDVAQSWAAASAKFLADKEVADYPSLALATDQWNRFGATEAALNGDQESLAIWAKYSPLLSEAETYSAIESLEAMQQCRILAANSVMTELLGASQLSISEGLRNDVLQVCAMRNSSEAVSTDLLGVRLMNVNEIANISLQNSVNSSALRNININTEVLGAISQVMSYR